MILKSSKSGIEAPLNESIEGRLLTNCDLEEYSKELQIVEDLCKTTRSNYSLTHIVLLVSRKRRKL